jgi:arylsulfatase A-like enzyme
MTPTTAHELTEARGEPILPSNRPPSDTTPPRYSMNANKPRPRFADASNGRSLAAVRAIAVAVGVLATPNMASAEAADAKPGRPNFVLVMCDDLGWGDLAYNGNPDVKTPVLDEMAKSGIRFDRFYAAYNVCSPTRGSFLTGRHPVRYGVFSWGWSLRPAEITLAEALRPAGYATGHFGKWHLGNLSARSATSPGAQGFDEWSSSPNFYENDPLFSRRGRVEKLSGESSLVTVDRALEFIETTTKEKQPFAAVVWFGNPHQPHVALEELKKPYEHLPPAMQNYWGEITGIDRAMGRLRTRLRELGAADNTLLLFTSDNGAAKPGSTGGLRGVKGTNYEGGLREPGLIEWPARLKEPRVVTVPCGTVDILPTVLAAAGVSHPQADRPLDGQDVLPIVEGHAEGRAKGLGFWTYPIKGRGMKSSEILTALAKEQAEEPSPKTPATELIDEDVELHSAKYPENSFPGHAAWVDGRYKLHWIPAANAAGGEAEIALFDLESDREETNDLSQSDPERTAKMTAELRAWQESVLRSLNGADDK